MISGPKEIENKLMSRESDFSIGNVLLGTLDIGALENVSEHIHEGDVRAGRIKGSGGFELHNDEDSIQWFERIEELHPNMVVQGYVKNLMPKGGFIMSPRRMRKLHLHTCDDTEPSYLCFMGRYLACTDLGFQQSTSFVSWSETDVSTGGSNLESLALLMKFGGHKAEGYAIDWSPLVIGRLVSGDCDSHIHLWEPSSTATWNVDTTPFDDGHDLSVDLQWSPSERDVFASCSVDRPIPIWDTRRRKPAATIKANKADVKGASCMLASGSDDGTFTVRDLRPLKELNK
ncbi:hypothetical protein MKX03_027112 [Papaver bracteatum]|nr:hypothetical protein MKX03_027112 [Papaver bracteatum]